MTTRQIIKIDEVLCDGCGQCVTACAEGAIEIIGGKARLVSESYCDGLGACLGDCPQGALTIEQREADHFDEGAVKEHLAALRRASDAVPSRPAAPLPTSAPEPTPALNRGSWAAGGGCPGSALRALRPNAAAATPASPPAADDGADLSPPSRLGHWPVQICLVPPSAPFLQGADLLVCADCVPFTVSDFHQRYLDGRAVLVGCPKLDDLPFYFKKLEAILAESRPRRITVLRMEVPCCAGIAQAVVEARNRVVPETELSIHTVSIQGGGVPGGIREESIAPNSLSC